MYLKRIEQFQEVYPLAEFRVVDHQVILTIHRGSDLTIMYLDKFGTLDVLINNYGTDEDRHNIYMFMKKWSEDLENIREATIEEFYKRKTKRKK